MNSTTYLPLLWALKTSQDSKAWNLAWKKFAELYAERIWQWACVSGRRWGLPEPKVREIAEEIRQEVLLDIHNKMETYDLDKHTVGGYRNWLRKVTHNALTTYLRRQPRDRGAGDTDVWELLLQEEARAELEGRVESEIQQEVFQEARAQWWESLSAREKEICQALGCLDGRSTTQRGGAEAERHSAGKELAERLGLTPAAVYQVKKRALDKLKKMALDLRSKYDLDDPR